MSSTIMMLDDEEEDAAAKAFASISAQLKEFTSPKLGSLYSTPSRGGSTFFQSQDDAMMSEEPHDPYQMDTMDWMEQELKEEPLTAPAPRVLKQTPLLERADTPVMSNSSSQRPLVDLDESEDGLKDRPVLEPVKTPAHKPLPRPKIVSPRAISSPAALSFRGSTQLNPNQSPLLYRRYHDTLWGFLKSKRSLSRRLDLELASQTVGKEQQQQLQALQAAPSVTSELAPDVRRTELEYLSQLQQLCWSAPSPETFLEGDFWLLLASLRQLGLSALVWENDHVSTAQNSSAQAGFVQQLAGRIQDPPAELLARLASDQAPLVLQRRYSILQWSQACMDQVRVEPKSRTGMGTGTHPDDNSGNDAPSLVGDSSQQLDFLQACLGYILAGRLEDAKALARSTGQAWRAATWAGGEASGFEKSSNAQTRTVEVKATGNPNRFLWKRQVWKNARRFSAMANPTNAPGGWDTGSSNTSTRQVEGTIYALLADDLQTSLASPSLRSWSQAHCAAWMAMWGRLEDEVLHLHNNHRRNEEETGEPPYPGTQYKKKESEQLLCTASLGGMTEFTVMQLLLSSPFVEIRGEGSYERAMTAFCLGKSAILSYCQDEASQADDLLQTDSSEEDQDAALAQLRFLTHLTLYLDSLEVSTTPTVLDGMTDLKNRILFQYVKHLESRRELWNLVTLYVSLLPEDRLIQWYPTMLAKVLDDNERQDMLEKMGELFPHLSTEVLRRTVRISLGSQMGLSDFVKCQSIQWLLFKDSHAGEALICANILLREFFLDTEDDKMEVAMDFVEENLPDDLLENAEQTILPDGENGSDKDDESSPYSMKVDNARSEYMAFLSYLDAYRTFGKWKELLEKTPTTISDANSNIDLANLNATEQEIAKQRMVRDWTRQKKKHFQAVLEAAEKARTVLHSVLTHPGGWLSFDGDEEDPGFNDSEEKKRRNDIAEIQSRYLGLGVNLYHQVCEETASWMSRSLEDAVHLTRVQALEELQNPACQPSVWYQHSLDLAILIADDRHGIHKAIGSNALQEILAKLAETAVSKLMDASR